MDFNFESETITPTAGTTLTISSTGALIVPFGTTAERPTPGNGFVRYNTDLSALEFYNTIAVAWQVSGNSETNGIATLSTTGLVTRTASGTYTTRSLVQPAAGITVTNDDGVAGNPTFALADDLLALEGLSGTGIAVRSAANTWVQRTVVGTTNRISLSNGDGVSGDPTIDIAATYVGQTSITTLGTITTGTWNGTTVAVNKGGTGLTAGTSGGVLGYTATGTLASSVLLTASALVLGGGAGATPTPMGSLGTTTTVLHGNAAGAPTFGAVSLTTDVSGTLPPANGGTGLISYTQGDLIYASATDTLIQLAKDTNATRYLSNTGASNNPAWAQVNLANGVTGDLPFANLTQGSARSVLGVTGNATADVASIQGTADQALVVNSAGTALAFGTVAIAGGGTGQVTQTTGFNALSPTTTKGDLIVDNGTDAVRLAIGTNTFVLTADSVEATGVKWAASPAASSALSAIQAAVGANSINNGDFAQTWNWALTTASKVAFDFTENTAAINGVGAQYLVDIGTIAASTANPIRIQARATDILTVTSVGVVTLQGSDTGTGSAITLRGGNSSTAATAGASVTVNGGTSGTSGTGGGANLTGGIGGTTGVGGAVTVTGGAGGTVSGNAGGVTVIGGTPVAGAGGAIAITGSAGVGTNQNGGAVTIQAGAVTGTGTGSTITFNTNGATQRGQFTQAGSFVLGNAALATSATDGFIYLAGGAGKPTGNPTAFTGRVPLYYDTTNDVLYSTANALAANQWRPVADMNSRFVHSLKDDFMVSGIVNSGTSKEPGELSWWMTQSAAATNSIQASEADHPGIYRAVTGAVNGNNSAIHFAGSAATLSAVMANQVAEFVWIVRVPTITTIITKVGLSQDPTIGTAATWGTDGVWFEFSAAANANWRCYTRSAGTSSTALNTTVAVTAGNWYVLRAVRNTTTNWEFFVNDVSRGTIATNLPTVAVNVGAIVQTAAASARNLDLDYFYIATEVMGNRYT